MVKVYNIVFGAVLIVSILLNVHFYCRPKVAPEQVSTTIIDTLVVRDTVRITEPIHIKETIVRYDTVFLPMIEEMESIGDDSVRVEIPITQKVYEDSLYKAWVSGYNQRLDSLHLYRKEVYVPMVIETKEKPKVVVSVGGFAGFGTRGTDFGVGISVGVPIWSW